MTVQTDAVTNLDCGTSSGTVAVFRRIEVVNRLKPSLALETVRNYTVHYDRAWIFDRVHHIVNEICSVWTLREVFIDRFSELDDLIAASLRSTLAVWAPGVEIIAVRTSKPDVPSELRANFERAEVRSSFLSSSSSSSS